MKKSLGENESEFSMENSLVSAEKISQAPEQPVLEEETR